MNVTWNGGVADAEAGLAQLQHVGLGRFVHADTAHTWRFEAIQLCEILKHIQHRADVCLDGTTDIHMAK